MIGLRTHVLRNRMWVSAATLIIGLGTAGYTGGWIVEEKPTSLSYAGPLAIFCAIALAIVKDWRAGFYIFVTWLPFEVLFHKFMRNNMVIHFAKDALAAVTYFSLIVSARRGRALLFHFLFPIFLSLLFWLGVVQCFSSSSPSFLYGLLGFKLYFYCIAMTFVGYAFNRTHENPRRFDVLNMGLAGAISILGVIQSVVGPSFWNRQAIARDFQQLSSLCRAAPASIATTTFSSRVIEQLVNV
jgi:hypothetical protein